MSFARYVARRKDAAAAREREAAGYAYSGDVRARSLLGRLRPVALALEAARQHWRTHGRTALVTGSVRLGSQKFPELAAVVQGAFAGLRVGTPDAYVTPSASQHEALVLGDSDDPVVALPSRLVDYLTPDELRAVVARLAGHVQNGHVEYLTALWALSDGADLADATLGETALRWAGAPARLALTRWARRAAITADRAALVVTGDLNRVKATLEKVETAARGLLSRPPQAPTAADPGLALRLEALALFARTTFFRGATEGAPATEAALSKDACDALVAQLFREVSP